VHAGLIETVPSKACRALAIPLQISLAVIVEHVVFAGDVVNRQVSAPNDLIGVVELLGF
jgi:hypothetical protein